MRTIGLRLSIFVLILLCLAPIHTTAGADQDPLIALFDRATETTRPVLVMMTAEWCVDCNAFMDKYHRAPALRDPVLTKTHFLELDAEKGSGPRWAKNWNVRHYPTFLLLDGQARLLDRWYGFSGEEKFLEHFEAALHDPIPVEVRQQRFRVQQDPADARKLGELAYMSGHFAEAVAYYRQGLRLEPESLDDQERILSAMIEGAYVGLFSFEEASAKADQVLGLSELPDIDYFKLSSSLVRLARKQGRLEDVTGYIESAYEKAETSTSPYADKFRSRLAPDYALHVEKNPTRAFQLVQENQPEGWREKSYYLNNVAWWCFENRIQLEKGEALARKGVEFAEPGVEKANVLDTLAEIVFLRGNVDEAVDLIEQAIEEAPDRPYFRRQLARFRDGGAR